MRAHVLSPANYTAVYGRSFDKKEQVPFGPRETLHLNGRRQRIVTLRTKNFTPVGYSQLRPGNANTYTDFMLLWRLC